MDGGLLPGRIAIESEYDARTQCLTFDLQRSDQLYGSQRIIGNQTPHDFGMFGTERSTASGYGGIDAGQMHGHHIGVAFDDHHLTLLHDRGFCHIDAVQHLVLAIQLRIGGIDVLRVDRVILIQLARAETKRTACRIANRPSHTPAKIIVDAVLTLTRKARIEHLLLREALACQMAYEIVPTLRRVSAAESLAVSLAEITAIEQFAGGKRLSGHQLRYEELLRRFVRFEQTGTLRTGMLGLGVRLIVTQLDMVPVGQQFHRITEVDVFLLLHIAEHVAAEATAETMPHAERGTHRKTRGLLVMEGT